MATGVDGKHPYNPLYILYCSTSNRDHVLQKKKQKTCTYIVTLPFFFPNIQANLKENLPLQMTLKWLPF